MQLLILSDIHGNLSALRAVLRDAERRFAPEALVLLGDNIDYGMRSNEVIEELKSLSLPVICSLWGNHEHAIMTQEYTGFSSQRGVTCALRTRNLLNESSLDYLDAMEVKNGKKEFSVCGKKILAVHGNRENPLWGSIKPGAGLSGYAAYDFVLSGHTHQAHAFPVFYDCTDKKYRNKKRTMFLNPGSVGQPRNHDPRAQYAILDFQEGVYLCGVEYDIKLEQRLFTEEVDAFYRDRLALGV